MSKMSFLKFYDIWPTLQQYGKEQNNFPHMEEASIATRKIGFTSRNILVTEKSAIQRLRLSGLQNQMNDILCINYQIHCATETSVYKPSLYVPVKNLHIDTLLHFFPVKTDKTKEEMYTTMLSWYCTRKKNVLRG